MYLPKPHVSMTVARQGMPRQQLQQQSGITSHMEMLRLFGVARSVFQHSGWVTARCVEKNQGQFWPLIQEKMPCEGEDVMRRNCLPAVLKITFAGLSSSSTLESSKFAFAVGGCQKQKFSSYCSKMWWVFILRVCGNRTCTFTASVFSYPHIVHFFWKAHFWTAPVETNITFLLQVNFGSICFPKVERTLIVLRQLESLPGLEISRQVLWLLTVVMQPLRTHLSRHTRASTGQTVLT